MKIRIGITLALFLAAFQNAMSASALPEGARLSNPIIGNMVLEIPSDGITGVKTRYLEKPNRIVIEFEDFDFSALPNDFGQKVRGVEKLQYGKTQNGARMVLTLKSPFALKNFRFDSQAIDGKMGLAMEFEPVDDDEFHEFALQISGVDTESIPAPQVELGNSKPIIVIDAGHGGVDPGAKRDGVYEKQITLNAANIIADTLRQTGKYQVIMTRDEDVFISLLARRQFAESVGADLFLSIHADALAEGDASGTTIYEVSDEASTQIAAHFARYENRVELFAGEIDYTEETDMGLVLSDMAHEISKEKSNQIARILQMRWQNINQNPKNSRRESADFAVLKAPDIPSLLLEIGYMSNDNDFSRIQNSQWLTKMAQNLQLALEEYFSTL